MSVIKNNKITSVQRAILKKMENLENITVSIARELNLKPESEFVLKMQTSEVFQASFNLFVQKGIREDDRDFLRVFKDVMTKFIQRSA